MLHDLNPKHTHLGKHSSRFLLLGSNNFCSKAPVSETCTSPSLFNLLSTSSSPDQDFKLSLYKPNLTEENTRQQCQEQKDQQIQNQKT